MAIKGVEFRLSRQLLLADGSDATGLLATLKVRVKIDGGAWGTSDNAPTEPDPTNDPGAYETVLSAAEMAGDQIQVALRDPAAITVLTTIDTVDPALFKADLTPVQTVVDDNKVEIAKVIKSGEQADYVSDLGNKAVTATRV